MIFDDHDVNDDWNISESWVGEMRALPWWEARITGAFMSYWLYQHLGNLSPPEIAEEEMLHARPGGRGRRARASARSRSSATANRRQAAGRTTATSADTRLLVIDSRAARVLGEGHREMIDEGEWDWIVEHSRGAFDHLIVASTLPYSCRTGSTTSRPGTRPSATAPGDARGAHRRDGSDVPSIWSIGPRSTTPSNGSATSSCAMSPRLRGEGHPQQSWSSAATSTTRTWPSRARHETTGPSRVYQIVCSPFRNPLSAMQRHAVQMINSRPAAAVARLLARLARVTRSRTDWRLIRQPSFLNSLGELHLHDRAARATLYRSAHKGEDPERLYELDTTDLAPD